MLPRILLVLALAASAAAQPPAKSVPTGVVGVWEGTLKPGPVELRMAFKIQKGDGDTLAATLDSIDQGAKDIPVSEVTFEGRKLTVSDAKMQLRYTGTLSDDGTTIAGEFVQGGLKLPFVLKRVDKASTLNRPQTPKKPYPYRAESATFENPKANVKLAGELTLPKGAGPFPAVVLVSGSGPQDRDETLFGHKPFLVLADHLTRKGVAVLRYDDRGIGASGGSFAGATTADFASDAHAAIAFLKARKDIDPKRIGTIGHSEGGLIGPMIAAEHPDDLAFVVMLGGPGLPGDRIIEGQIGMLLKAMGQSAEKIQVTLRLQRAIVAEVKKGGPADEVKDRVKTAAKAFFEALPEAERKLLGGDKFDPAAPAAQVGDPWVTYFFNRDPRPTLSKVRCPVLAVNGELDLQVGTENLDAIAKAVKAGGNEAVTTKAFPKLNHLFQKAKTGLPNEYGQIEETFDPETLAFIADWVVKRTKR